MFFPYVSLECSVQHPELAPFLVYGCVLWLKIVSANYISDNMAMLLFLTLPNESNKIFITTFSVCTKSVS